jgi:hypothetical protein
MISGKRPPRLLTARRHLRTKHALRQALQELKTLQGERHVNRSNARSIPSRAPSVAQAFLTQFLCSVW